MELQRFRLPFAIALTVVYNAFFWQEKMGINLPIFSLLVMGILLFLNPEARDTRYVWLMALGTLLSGLMVVLHNSGTAKLVHLCSLLLFAGFVHLPQLRSAAFALVGILASYLQVGLSLYEELMGFQQEHQGFRKAWTYGRLVLIPLGVLSLFFTLFKLANPRFDALSAELLTWLGSWFADFSFPHFLFILSGFVLATGLIYNRHLNSLAKQEARAPEQLVRQRRKRLRAFSFIGLKKEYLTGLLLVGLVNVLLLINNAIDIDWIWLGFELPENFSLTQFVHEGTYLLILSILLSMGIMLYFFRENQHFFHRGGWLHRLSYLWILQNGILLVSVGLRNYHYIAYHGLAYKRIGVIFFLLLTLVGLLTLFLKIRDAKSAFYLFRVNGWAVYAMMLSLCLINWDPFIARYNLTQDYPGRIDTEFLLSLSDKALPVLMKHRELFTHSPDGYEQQPALAKKIEHFRTQYESYGWLSWNQADARAYHYLQSVGFEQSLVPYSSVQTPRP